MIRSFLIHSFSPSLDIYGSFGHSGKVCLRDKAAQRKKSAVTPSSICGCYKEPEKRCLKVFLLLQVLLLLSWYKDASHSAADCVRQESAFRPQLTLQNRRNYNAGRGGR